MDITKTVNNLNPEVNTQVVFTITAKNKGPGNATGVIIEDIIQNGFQYVSHNASSGSYNPNTGEWSVGTIVYNTYEQLEITVTVNEPESESTYTNLAEVTYAIPQDPNTDNNESLIEITPKCLPSWTIEKTAKSTTYDEVGQTIEYDIMLSNTGNVKINSVNIIDDKAISAPIYLSGDTNNNNALDIDEVWHYTVGSQVSQFDMDYGSFKNTVTAIGSTICGSLLEASDTETVYADSKPGINLEKTAISGMDYVNVGDIITYEYKITNTGNVSLDYFEIEDDKIGILPPIDEHITPGNSKIITADYFVKIEDIQNGSVTNIANVSTEHNGIIYSNSDSATVQARPTMF